MTEIKRPDVHDILNFPTKDLGFDGRVILISGDAVVPTNQMRYVIPLKNLAADATYDFVNWKDFTLPSDDAFVAKFGAIKTVEELQKNPEALAASLTWKDPDGRDINQWARQQLAAKQSNEPKEQDVLLLNSLTEEQMADLELYAASFEKKNGKPLSDISSAEEVVALFSMLDKMGIKDRYRSEMEYCDNNLKARDAAHTGETGQGFYGRTRDVRFAAKQKNADGSETMLIAYLKKEKVWVDGEDGKKVLTEQTVMDGYAGKMTDVKPIEKEGNVINGNVNNEWSLYQRADGNDIKTILGYATAKTRANGLIKEAEAAMASPEKKAVNAAILKKMQANNGR